MKDYEQVYEDFWKSIVENEDGGLNLDQVKKELADFRFMLSEVPKVYSFVTGEMLSKPNYYASSVITEANEYIDRCVREAVEDFLATYGVDDPRRTVD